MPPALKPVARLPLLHLSVQEAVRAFILDNKLRPGDPLPPETDLARQLGVSRNSVREAVKGMESLGILETRRGSGLYVRAFSFDPLLENLAYGLLFDLRELAELMDVRRVLETGFIGAAMQAMPAAALAALRDDVNAMKERASRGESFEEEDRRFHQILFEPLGNRTVLKLLDIFWLTYREASRHVDMRNPDPIATYEDHAAIYEAVAGGDVEAARAALDRHYSGLARRLARAQAQLENERAEPPQTETAAD